MKKALCFLLFSALILSSVCFTFAEEDTFVIACVGDSVTEGMMTSGGLKGPDAYPAVLAGLIESAGIENVEVKNYGKSATTAQTSGDVPYKESLEYRNSLKCDPDVVLIGLGANDSKKANWDADRYEAHYQSLILEYMMLPSHPTVYLIYTTYVADQSKTGCQRSTIQAKILPIQKTIATDLELKIIDLNTLTKKNADKYADGVHPNDELQAMMAEYVFNALCAEGVAGLSAQDATATVSMIDPNASAEDSKKTDTATSTTSDAAIATDSSITSDVSDTEISENASSATLSHTDEGGNGESGDGLLLGGIIAGVAVLLAGCAVAVILLVRKKK